MSKQSYVPKRLDLVDIQQAFRMLLKIISTPSIEDLPEMTLAQLNAIITDADVDDDGEQREPTTHASTHFPGGADDVVGRLVISEAGVVMVDDTSKHVLIWQT